jgi:hypothetical protein
MFILKFYRCAMLLRAEIIGPIVHPRTARFP